MLCIIFKVGQEDSMNKVKIRSAKLGAKITCIDKNGLVYAEVTGSRAMMIEQQVRAIWSRGKAKRFDLIVELIDAVKAS